MGAGISGGGPHGAHEAGGAPRGWERPVPSWPNDGPPGVFSVPDILKYSTKNHISFSGHLGTFILGVFLLQG